MLMFNSIHLNWEAFLDLQFLSAMPHLLLGIAVPA